MATPPEPHKREGWIVEDHHEARGLTAYKRKTPEVDRISRGRCIEDDVQVWTDTGERLVSTSMSVDYEYFAIVQASFSEDGLALEVCGQGGEITTAIYSCETGERLLRTITNPGD